MVLPPETASNRAGPAYLCVQSICPSVVYGPGNPPRTNIYRLDDSGRGVTPPVLNKKVLPKTVRWRLE